MSWPKRWGPKRGPWLLNPWDPHRFISSLVNLTDCIESPHATTNFVCTVWFRLTQSSCVPTGDSMALMVAVCQEGAFTYLFLTPVNTGGC